ncbi:MAG: hypothetical protein ACI9JL_002460 [Paracoccaceae bacterium]|jgi:hypothetical protein
MSKLVDKLIVAAASSVLAFSAIAPASATTWIVTNVLTVGNDGGFGASSFHDARGNVMSGSNIANITGGAFGTYNDVTGALDLTATVTQGANTFELNATSAGGFNFNATGWLAANSTLNVSMNHDVAMPSGSTLLSGTVTELGFKLGDVCCSGGINNSNPNSFMQPGSDDDERWMTLWGANSFNIATGQYDYQTESTLGMDVRIRLERGITSTEVPAPAVTVIFGFGLIGLAYMRRRKTV